MIALPVTCVERVRLARHGNANRISLEARAFCASRACDGTGRAWALVRTTHSPVAASTSVTGKHSPSSSTLGFVTPAFGIVVGRGIALSHLSRGSETHHVQPLSIEDEGTAYVMEVFHKPTRMASKVTKEL